MLLKNRWTVRTESRLPYARIIGNAPSSPAVSRTNAAGSAASSVVVPSRSRTAWALATATASLTSRCR